MPIEVPAAADQQPARVPRLFDAREAGDVLHLHKDNVLVLIRRGELRATRVGNKFLIRDDVLAAYIDALTDPEGD